MTSRTILAAAMAFAIVGYGTAAAAKDDPVVLQPSSAWNLDYSKDSCTLRRVFGEGDQQAVLELRQFAPNRTLQGMVLAKGIDIDRSPMRYRWEPAPRWSRPFPGQQVGLKTGFKGFIFPATALYDGEISEDDSKEAIYDGGLIRDYYARVATHLRSATAFSISGGFERNLTLNTGSLDAPHKALAACVEELQTHWGIDVEAHKSLTRLPKPTNYAPIVHQLEESYPSDMLLRGMPGIVPFRLDVSQTGTVTGCHVQLEISNQAYERTTCDYLTRLQFEPALDAQGQPLASYYANTAYFSFGRK